MEIEQWIDRGGIRNGGMRKGDGMQRALTECGRVRKTE